MGSIGLQSCKKMMKEKKTRLKLCYFRGSRFSHYTQELLWISFQNYRPYMSLFNQEHFKGCFSPWLGYPVNYMQINYFFTTLCRPTLIIKQWHRLTVSGAYLLYVHQCRQKATSNFWCTSLWDILLYITYRLYKHVGIQISFCQWQIPNIALLGKTLF